MIEHKVTASDGAGINLRTERRRNAKVSSLRSGGSQKGANRRCERPQETLLHVVTPLIRPN